MTAWPEAGREPAPTVAVYRVDLIAKRTRRRDHSGSIPFRVRELQPAHRDIDTESFPLDFGDAIAQLLEGRSDLAPETGEDGLFQVYIALAHDLVHHHRLHARPFQLRERLAGFYSVELLLVAHQDHARNAERRRDPEQVAHLCGRGKEASSTTSRVLPNEDRGCRKPLAVPRPSAMPAWRARKRCSVWLSIPDSCPSVRAAEAEGARPITR